MKIAIDCGYHKDIVSVPEEIGAHIDDFVVKFGKWIYDKDNDHGYWIYIDGKKKAVSVGIDNFLEHINKYHLADSKEKAYVVEKELQDIPEDMPVMYL